MRQKIKEKKKGMQSIVMKIVLQIQVAHFYRHIVSLPGRGLNISLIDEHGHPMRLQHANVKV